MLCNSARHTNCAKQTAANAKAAERQTGRVRLGANCQIAALRCESLACATLRCAKALAESGVPLPIRTIRTSFVRISFVCLALHTVSLDIAE